MGHLRFGFKTGAGFYVDATNPKFARHYNMRTHIQFEIPQVLEVAGLPIVNRSLAVVCPFSYAELNPFRT
jgi:S-formylglutathione hydrolase FrmB